MLSHHTCIHRLRSRKMRRDNNERKGPRQPPEENADQAIVLTPFGRGVVVRTRESDGIREVRLLGWGGGGGDPDPTAEKDDPSSSGGDHNWRGQGVGW